jgi:hypothetical protein
MKAKRRVKKPWQAKVPVKKRRTTLTAAQKARSKASAKRAGRRYPNLVDNMLVIRKTKRK